VTEDLPDDPLQADDPGGEGARSPGSLADGVKKALLAGVGALFMTEESARRLARDWKLPKDVIDFVGRQAHGAKDEILRVFAGEIRRFLESESLRAEFWKRLTESTVELEVRIRFRPEPGGAARPSVEASARTRKPRRGRKPAGS
jgi:hypothetical protein